MLSLKCASSDRAKKKTSEEKSDDEAFSLLGGSEACFSLRPLAGSIRRGKKGGVSGSNLARRTEEKKRGVTTGRPIQKWHFL